ncbi:GIY-YIG nuclease family protein [Hydrogenophaga sp. YM1]|uniref:GIY-YIG nuclease family protein n=1 Tax=Hydrogenophaga sp. YM1 TaxID=2806262 RepID=UPI00195D1BFF|nr:GIY-YIG nuclease family protein [Hydrogenophaga sp. YM1]QRR34693.1 GIY-YIG nuclease family protein [Hydrogenophaga sp. YM1]
MSKHNGKFYAYVGVLSQAAASQFGRPIVKVGHSAEPRHRLSNIGKDLQGGALFDLVRSIALLAPSCDDSRRLEDALKTYFNEFQVNPESVPFGRAGKTEWYEASILQRLNVFLQENALGFEVIQEHGHFDHHPEDRPSSPSYLQCETPRAQARDAQRAKEFLDALIGLEGLAIEIEVGAWTSLPDYLNLNMTTVANPVITAEFRRLLKVLKTNARCDCANTSIIDVVRLGESFALIKFRVRAGPVISKEKCDELVVERLFSQPISYLRQMVGVRTAPSLQILRRFGQLPTRGSARSVPCVGAWPYQAQAL